MTLTTNVFIALGLAADAFAVSLSSGIQIRNIKINKALKIALCFGVFQTLMPLVGWWAGLSFRDLISAFDHWVAFGLLSFIGGRMIYEATEEETSDKKFNPLDIYTLLVLSIATSLDALAVGIGFAVLKTSIFAAIAVIGFVTFFLCFIGVFAGHKFGSLLQNKIEMLGGLILIIIAIKILLENLISVHA